MLRVMLSMLIITGISPAKCQENTESIVETTSSRSTTGTIFNDLVDTEFIGEGVTGFSGFIPDDTESVNTEGKHELKDPIQTTSPRQNFTTLTTPVTLSQTEIIVQDKKIISETDDIISTTNAYFNVPDKYNVQATTNDPSNVISTTISDDERTFTNKQTEFTTKQTLFPESTKDNLGIINSDYIYDDQIYEDEDDRSSVTPIDKISTREITSQPKDGSTSIESNDKEYTYASDEANTNDLINFDDVTTTEDTIATIPNNLGENTVRDHKIDEFSEEYDEDITSTMESILTTTSLPEETISDNQFINFPLNFDIEESIITIPSVLMEQMTTKTDSILEQLDEKNSFSNVDSDGINFDVEINDGALSTGKDESTEAIRIDEAPITLPEEITPEKAAIDEETIEFQDLETPAYDEINEEIHDHDVRDKNILEENNSDSDIVSSLNFEELVNRNMNENILSSKASTEEAYAADLFTSTTTLLPIVTTSKESEQSIFDGTDFITSTSKEFSAVETSTLTKIYDNQTLTHFEESSVSTEKNNLIYSSNAIAEESTVAPIYSLNPHILKQSEILTTDDILHLTTEAEEAITTTTITDEMSSTFQKHQDFSNNYLNVNSTEDLSTISLEELSPTDGWEDGNGDSYYSTTIKDEETSIETTTNIIHVWLAQENIEKNTEENVLSTFSEEYDDFSRLNPVDDETTPRKDTNYIDDVTRKYTDAVNIEDITEITENDMTYDKSETTFQTTTTSTDSIDYVTRNPTDSVFPDESITSESSTIFRKLDEATTSQVIYLGVDVNDLSEDVQTSTNINILSETTDLLDYTDNDDGYKLTDTQSRHYQTTPTNQHEPINQNSSIKHEKFLTTEEPNLLNSITKRYSDLEGDSENSTIFSKELVENGQFTADAINILKENDYETTENFKSFVENIDFHEYTENPVFTITEENINSFSILPPLEKLETLDEFEKHMEIIEHPISTESVSFSTIKYITTKEDEEFIENNMNDIVTDKSDGVIEISQIYEDQTSDLPSPSSTIAFDIIKANEKENTFNISSVANEEKVDSTIITTTVVNDFKEEFDVTEDEEDIINEPNINKIESQESLEDDSAEREITGTSTNQKFLKNSDSTKTVKEESNEEDTEEDTEVGEETFENEATNIELAEENVNNGNDLEESYKEDEDHNHTEEDQFQKDDIITTDTIISSMKELEDLDNETLNQTQTAFKASDELTTSLNSLEYIDVEEESPRPKIHKGEQELFSKYVFKTYIDRTTTERVQTEDHEILSTPDNDFGNLLNGESGNNLDHILTDREAKLNMSAEKAKNWPKLSLNELLEEDEKIINNEEDELDNVNLSEDALANETSDNSYTDPASVNYYDEDYTNSKESNSTEVIDSDSQNEASTYLSIIPNRRINEFCLQGNISLRMFIGEHGTEVPGNSQVLVNCSHEIYNLIISWRSVDLETSNSTIFFLIEVRSKEYFIESVEVIHIDTVEAIKSVRSGLILLTTPVGETMTGSFTIDFENGYQVEVIDINLRLSQLDEYSDLEQASQSKPIISKMTIIIICTSATSCLVFIVTAIILYKKFSAKATIYKMTIE